MLMGPWFTDRPTLVVVAWNEVDFQLARRQTDRKNPGEGSQAKVAKKLSFFMGKVEGARCFFFKLERQ